MKNVLYVFVIALVATACSGPKYTASFNSLWIFQCSRVCI